MPCPVCGVSGRARIRTGSGPGRPVLQVFAACQSALRALRDAAASGRDRRLSQPAATNSESGFQVNLQGQTLALVRHSALEVTTITAARPGGGLARAWSESTAMHVDSGLALLAIGSAMGICECAAFALHSRLPKFSDCATRNSVYVSCRTSPQLVLKSSNCRGGRALGARAQQRTQPSASLNRRSALAQFLSSCFVLPWLLEPRHPASAFPNLQDFTDACELDACIFRDRREFDRAGRKLVIRQEFDKNGSRSTGSGVWEGAVVLTKFMAQVCCVHPSTAHPHADSAHRSCQLITGGARAWLSSAPARASPAWWPRCWARRAST